MFKDEQQHATPNVQQLAFLTCVLFGSIANSASPWPSTFLADADLHAVHFADKELGIAVGERGVILVTSDGGNTWQFRTSEIGCQLNDVYLADNKTGWAGGGYWKSNTPDSVGVLLMTNDSGQTWRSVSKSSLPLIKAIRFHDPKRGLAATVQSQMFVTSLFTTTDGGTSWSTLPGSATAGWRAMGGQSLGRIFLVGNVGEFGVLAGGQLQRSHIPNAAPRPLQDVQQLDEQVFAVGGGAIWRFRPDTKWENIQGIASANPASHAFEFATLAVHGQHLWCAGKPGTMIYHSTDGGANWDARPTGQRLPIRDLHFVDANNGWAVGEQGIILRSTDGGNRWNIQRQPATGAAVLAIYPDTNSIDYETLTYLAAQHGFRTKVIVAGSSKKGASLRSLGWRQAVSETGASIPEQYWGFPLPSRRSEVSAEEVQQTWSQQTWSQSHALSQVVPSTKRPITERLVRTIRTWQPAMIVTSSFADGTNGVHTALEHAIAEAKTIAGETGRLQSFNDGLPAWRVSRQWQRVPSQQTATARLAVTEIAQPLGDTLEAIGQRCRNLALADSTVSVAIESDPIMRYKAVGATSGNDLIAGLRLARGSGQRRPSVPSSIANVDQLKRISMRRRTVATVLTKSMSSNINTDNLMAEVDQATQSLDVASQAMLRRKSIQLLLQRGKLNEALRVLNSIPRTNGQFGNSVLSTAALLRHEREALSWLMLRYVTSAEYRWWVTRSQRLASRAEQVGSGNVPLGAAQLERNPELNSRNTTEENEIALANAEVAQSGDQERQHQDAIATVSFSDPAVNTENWPKLLESLSLELSARPELRLALAAQSRGTSIESARREYMKLRSVWKQSVRRSAAAELALIDPSSAAMPKAVCRCGSGGRPKLDGVLDDPMWQATKFVSLNRAPKATTLDSISVQDSATCSVGATYDGRLLYLGIACPKNRYTNDDSKIKHRDAELLGQDRVVISLDTNRDYWSTIRLVVDQNGRSHDACVECAEWNPEWYITTKQHDSLWTAEIAIPVSELSGEQVKRGDTWNLGLRRLGPNVAEETWPSRVVESDPTTFGFLSFD